LGPSTRRVPWSHGVSFIELITLTAVLLILVMIGIPRVSPVVQQFRLKGAAWQLAGDLRLARQRAVTTQRRFRVCLTGCQISVPVGAYSIEVEHPPVGSLNWTSETGAPVRLPPDVCVSVGGSGIVTFAANGMASGNTFTLYNLIGEYQVIVASTGQVRIAEVTGTTLPSCS
jgi:Tfp pilus assembly protein FimT